MENHLFETHLNCMTLFVAICVYFDASGFGRKMRLVPIISGSTSHIWFLDLSNKFFFMSGGRNLAFLFNQERKYFINSRKRNHEHNLRSNWGILVIDTFHETNDIVIVYACLDCRNLLKVRNRIPTADMKRPEIIKFLP